MLPLVFLPETPTLLAGRGLAFLKRLRVLEAAGLTDLRVHTDAPSNELAAHLGDRLHAWLPREAEIAAVRLLFVAGLDDAESGTLAAQARGHRVPVNVEDVPPLCDFHVPAMVRRGGLTLTVSTAGGAPALSAAIRGWLEDAFGPEWAAHLEEVASLRATLRAQGAGPREVIRGVEDHLATAGWAPLGDGARCRSAAPPADA
jgi:precorrin-2 dehydrogenase/sirohydrochlorin ferrochelatase